MSASHLWRYLTEFGGRHNVRNADTETQMRGLARGMVGQVLMWKILAAGQVAA